MRKTGDELDREDAAYRAAHPPLTPEQIAERNSTIAREVLLSMLYEAEDQILCHPEAVTAEVRSILARISRRVEVAPPD